MPASYRERGGTRLDFFAARRYFVLRIAVELTSEAAMSAESVPANAEYERRYSSAEDPYDYFSAGEQAKYAGVLAAAKRWRPQATRVLEAACGLGYVTRLLADFAPEVFAYDFSPTAVARTRARCADLPPGRVQIDVGNALAPNYPPASFDVVILGDIGMFHDLDQRGGAIRAALALAKDDGVLILTDCIKSSQQADYTAFVERCGAETLERLYFHDRYWMKFRSLVKSVGGGKQVLASPTLHRWLTNLGRLRGPAGSKHFGLVVRPIRDRA